jgi:hypothetical protein
VLIMRSIAAALLLVAFLGSATPGTASAKAPADDIVTRLQHLPNVTYLSEAPNPPAG